MRRVGGGEPWRIAKKKKSSLCVGDPHQQAQGLHKIGEKNGVSRWNEGQMLHRAEARQSWAGLGELLRGGAKWSSRADRLGGCRRLIVGDYELAGTGETWTWTCRRFWLDLVLTESRCIFILFSGIQKLSGVRPFFSDRRKQGVGKNPSGGAKSELEVNQESQSNRHTACFCQGGVGAESLLPAVRQRRADVTLAQLCLGVSFWHPTILATTLNEL